MPANETVEERIVADVVSTLGTIAAGADFYTSVERVYQMYGSVLTAPELPCVVVLDGGVKTKYGCIDRVESRLALTLSLALNRDDNWQRDIRRFVLDVQKALRVDCQRGTFAGVENAFDTYIVGHDVANESDGFPLAVAEVHVEIQFRHLLSDPTVAQ